MSDVTQILSRIEQGDPHAPAQLLEMVYDELRKLAAAKLAHEKPGHTLQATALVHEAYLRLVGNQGARSQEQGANEQISTEGKLAPGPGLLAPAAWNSRGHFFAAAAEAMRRILVDSARRKHAVRRGGGREQLDLNLIEPAAPRLSDDVLALNDALEKLERLDRAKAELVKLRYFGGLTMEQAAEALGISPATAHRHWNYARAWLHQEIVAEDNVSEKS